MISSELQVEAEVEVLIASVMAHILFGIYIVLKNVGNISALNASAKAHWSVS